MRRKWYGEIRTLFVIESGDDAIALSTGGGRSKTDRSGLTQPVADSLITLDTAVTTLDTSRGNSMIFIVISMEGLYHNYECII